MRDYPKTRREDLVETLHGQQIADPYRWLEDPDAPEVVDWVERQRAHTEAKLAALPERAWFADVMAQVVARPRAGLPHREGDWYFCFRNDGTQNQDVLYVASSLAELTAGGRVLLDPNGWSADGTDSISLYTVSPDGSRLAYVVSEAGSDWQKMRVLDVASGQRVPVVGNDPDSEIVSKFSLPTWLPDNASLLYNAFDDLGRAEGTDTLAVLGGRLSLHRLGDPLEADRELCSFPEDPQIMTAGELSSDRRWLVVTIERGTENVNRLWLYPLTTQDGATSVGEPLKLVDEPLAEMRHVRVDGDTLIVHTDLDAPRGCLAAIALAASAATGDLTLPEVVEEGEATLAGAVAAGEHVVVASLVDAAPQLRRYSVTGDDLGVLDVSGGALVGLDAAAGHDEVLVGLSSVVSPTTSYRVDAATGAVERLDLTTVGGFVPPEIRTERRHATSTDGTQVPYWLITRADLPLDAPRPTLMYGYGGFKIPVEADYRPGWSGWLAAGGVLAIANLRGGGEYGTAWYDAGRRAHKQNVFDDFAAVATHLAETGVTTAGQLAAYGRSNGGLLVGALLTQHPDLIACALPGVGVLDVLRFHLFTIGAAWMSDYGDPDDPDDFAVALAYSPLQNVREGTCYPPTLITTGDHDDRVVPLHSHKFAAALQHAQACDHPILTRIEVATGHGAGKPAAMLGAEWADMLAFAAHHTGLNPTATG